MALGPPERENHSSGSGEAGPFHSRTNGSPSAPPRARRGDVLFEVKFATVMRHCDLALLAMMLNLSTRVQPTIHSRHDTTPRHDTQGFARLDHYSGLFLKHGAVDGEWLLEARTWGRPAAQSVHEWHVLAAGAARELDPTVTSPDRLDVAAREISDRPLGRAANKRLARFRRRLVGVS